MTLIMKKGLLNDLAFEDEDQMREEIIILKKELRMMAKKKFIYKDSIINLISV